MTTLKDLTLAKRCRKGQAAAITKDGAYWLAYSIAISLDGGDGIGQSEAQIEDKLEVRHYRNNEVRAYLNRHTWHQNDGANNNRTRADQLLECDNLEDLIIQIQRVKINNEYEIEYFEVSESGKERVAKEIALPASLPAPDEYLNISVS